MGTISVTLGLMVTMLVSSFPCLRTDDGSDAIYSYLGFPRLHFAGRFYVDPITSNNYVYNLNMSLYNGPRLPSERHGFNIQGSGNFIFYETYVTSVCYGDGTCTYNDAIVGEKVEDWFLASPAKLIDIYTICDTLPSLYGLTLHIPGGFRATMIPTPSQNFWFKCAETASLYTASAAAHFKSVLGDVEWLDPTYQSRFLDEISEASGQALSIKFNMDMFDSALNTTSEDFLMGRLTGTIGPHHSSDSIPHMRSSRILRAEEIECAGLPFCHAPFVLNTELKLLTVDLGNSLRTTMEGQFDPDKIGRIALGVYKKRKIADLELSGDLDPIEVAQCDDIVRVISEVNYSAPEWYQDTAGVVTFDLSEDQVVDVSRFPMILFRITLPGDMNLTNKKNGADESVNVGDKNFISVSQCKQVVLAERAHGIVVGAMYNNTFKKDPGDRWNFTVFASKFGVPISGVAISVTFGDTGDASVFQLCGPCTPGFSIPQRALSLPKPVETDENGIAYIEITAHDPIEENGDYRNRVVLQGSQLYLLYVNFTVTTGLADETVSGDSAVFVLGIHVFQEYDIPNAPTWYDHVLPIFEPYSKLYPVMGKFFELTNYESVVRNADKIRFVLDLPLHHPNHMPVTRDLSQKKKEMILNWLDNPLLGADSTSVTKLRQLLQQALMLEFTTIPPYLSALMSIKDGSNTYIAQIIRSVVVQEMLHMVLVANILNAVGGAPDVTSPGVVPEYPTKLPGGVRPDLLISLEHVSIEYIESVFMEMEKPAQEISASCSRSNGNIVPGHEKSDCQDSAAPPSCSLSHEPYTKYSAVKASNQDISTNCYQSLSSNYSNTISSFYNRIKSLLVNLRKKDIDIFTGDPGYQINESLWYGMRESIRPFPIFNLSSALDAIALITEQGEGGDACLPLTRDQGDLSHYYKFAQIVQGREIRVTGKMDNGKEFPEERLNPNSESCNKNRFTFETLIQKNARNNNAHGGQSKSGQKEGNGKCEHNLYSVRQEEEIQCHVKYEYTGPRIPFNKHGVWPTIDNPNSLNLAGNPRAIAMSLIFDRMYTNLLHCLQESFSGKPDRLRDCIALMHALSLQGKALAAVPATMDIRGPTAGPTFKFLTSSRG